MNKTASAVSAYFFRLLEKHGIPTHFESLDAESGEITVKPTDPICQTKLHFLKYYYVTDDLHRHYNRFLRIGQKVDMVHIVTKDNFASNYPLNWYILVQAKVLSPEDVEDISKLFEAACIIIQKDLSSHGLDLWSISLSFGTYASKGRKRNWVVADTINASNNMYVCKDARRLINHQIVPILLGAAYEGTYPRPT